MNDLNGVASTTSVQNKSSTTQLLNVESKSLLNVCTFLYKRLYEPASQFIHGMVKLQKREINTKLHNINQLHFTLNRHREASQIKGCFEFAKRFFVFFVVGGREFQFCMHRKESFLHP